MQSDSQIFLGRLLCPISRASLLSPKMWDNNRGEAVLAKDCRGRRKGVHNPVPKRC